MFETYFCWYFQFEIILGLRQTIRTHSDDVVYELVVNAEITFQDASDASTTTHDNKK